MALGSEMMKYAKSVNFFLSGVAIAGTANPSTSYKIIKNTSN
jgi:hypothetical protein